MAVEVRAGDRHYTVSSAADVALVLAELEALLTDPTLIELRASDTVLHIGLGGARVSVALYLDAQRRPYFAEGADTGVPVATELHFDQNGITRRFFRRAGITAADARDAAIDFVVHDGARPPRLRWVAEGRPGTGASL